MTHSGSEDIPQPDGSVKVLIPLLLDDPLWAILIVILFFATLSLNPSFAG